MRTAFPFKTNAPSPSQLLCLRHKPVASPLSCTPTCQTQGRLHQQPPPASSLALVYLTSDQRLPGLWAQVCWVCTCVCEGDGDSGLRQTRVFLRFYFVGGQFFGRGACLGSVSPPPDEVQRRANPLGFYQLPNLRLNPGCVFHHPVVYL